MWKVVAYWKLDNLSDDNAGTRYGDVAFSSNQLSYFDFECGGDDTTDDEVKGLFRFLAGQILITTEIVQLGQRYRNNRIKRSCSR